MNIIINHKRGLTADDGKFKQEDIYTIEVFEGVESVFRISGQHKKKVINLLIKEIDHKIKQFENVKRQLEGKNDGLNSIDKK